MNSDGNRSPVLSELYQQYLVDQDTAAFIHRTSGRYSVATLARLAAAGERLVRRAAVLALGYVADYESNPTLGRALNDPDRGVRLLAENGIRALWCRVGNAGQRQRLARVMMLNNSQQAITAVAMRPRHPRRPVAGRGLEPAGDRPFLPESLRRVDPRLPAGDRDQPLSFRRRRRDGAVLSQAG